MKKKLLMLGASLLILGNSQISYGAAAFALEDDPSRRMSVPGERVDAALKDQMAREDEAKARHDVESHDTSFTRIGVKGLLRAGEQETLGQAVRSHHVSRGPVAIGDETSQEVRLQAPHVEAGSFIATANKETGTLEITDAQNYYMRQAVSKHRNLSSVTDILTPITMDWGTITRTQESSSHTTSVGAIIDTEEGSRLSAATIDLTNVAYEDIDGLGRHIIDGKKVSYN